MIQKLIKVNKFSQQFLALIEVNTKKGLELGTKKLNTTKPKLSIQIESDDFGVLFSLKIKSGYKY